MADFGLLVVGRYYVYAVGNEMYSMMQGMSGHS